MRFPMITEGFDSTPFSNGSKLVFCRTIEFRWLKNLTLHIIVISLFFINLIWAHVPNVLARPAHLENSCPELAELERPSALAQRLMENKGYIFLFRHAKRSGQPCESALQNPDGRDQADGIGKKIHGKIDFGFVMASPCERTMETAKRISLFSKKVEPIKRLEQGIGDVNDLVDELWKRRSHLEDTNILAVTHSPQINDLLKKMAAHKYKRVDQGEAAILRPLENKQFYCEARIKSDEWKDLLK